MANVSGMVTADFTGGSEIGPVSVTGLKVGDKILRITSSANPFDRQTYYEVEISVDDQIQQIVNADFSALTFGLIAYRPS